MKENGFIFLVDDSTTVSNILSAVIQGIGDLTVQDFQTGELMIQQLSVDKPKLIILDYILDTKDTGAMNGADVLKHIRSEGLEIPVIMLTGINDEKTLSELKTMEFDAIIHKDSDNLFEQLQETVKELLALNNGD